ncbi:MAG: acyl carrier protein [Bacteroidales bacterium]|nr:acyl carrier protein [Bacteroidales bacterium]
MSNLSDAKEKLKKFIAETSFKSIDKIQDDSMIFRDGIFDSMGLMTLITFLEENFQIQVQDTELIEENFESVNAIFRYLEKKSSN